MFALRKDESKDDNNKKEPLIQPASATETPATGDAPFDRKAYWKRMCLGGCAGILLTVFILGWLLQGLLYFVATTMNGCRAGSLADYDYKAGGGWSSDYHDAAYNVLPQMSFLTESPHSALWGSSFSVSPTNEASQKNSPVGVWWKSWGPYFNTYTFKSTTGHTSLLYMRANLLHLGQSHRVNRCDGKGPDIIFEEGMNFFGNRIRNFFGITQSFNYKIFVDDNHVATAEEAHTGVGGSITFLNATNAEEGKIADTVYQTKVDGKDEWLVTNEPKNDLPYYVISAAGLLYAFHKLQHPDKNGAPSSAPPHKVNLQAMQNAVAAFGDRPLVPADFKAAASLPEFSATQEKNATTGVHV